MSRHPESGAGHPIEVEPLSNYDRSCDYCGRTIYSGLLRAVTIGHSRSLLCSACFDRQQDRYTAMTERGAA